MSKLIKTMMSFAPSDSQDVVSYNLYYEKASDPTNLSYNSSWVPIINTTLDDNGNIVIDLKDYLGNNNIDGTYDLGLTAVDDAGNESDMQNLLGVTLDFVAPNPPGIPTLLV